MSNYVQDTLVMSMVSPCNRQGQILRIGMNFLWIKCWNSCVLLSSRQLCSLGWPIRNRLFPGLTEQLTHLEAIKQPPIIPFNINWPISGCLKSQIMSDQPRQLVRQVDKVFIVKNQIVVFWIVSMASPTNHIGVLIGSRHHCQLNDSELGCKPLASAGLLAPDLVHRSSWRWSTHFRKPRNVTILLSKSCDRVEAKLLIRALWQVEVRLDVVARSRLGLDTRYS